MKYLYAMRHMVDNNINKRNIAINNKKMKKKKFYDVECSFYSDTINYRLIVNVGKTFYTLRFFHMF